MTDVPKIQLADTPAPNKSVKDQARIRKERREAKIRAGGTARLSKITGISGGVGKDIDVSTPSILFPDSRELEISSHCDQNENIQSRSENIKTSPVASTMVNEAALHQMMHDMNSANTFFPDTSPFFTTSRKEEAITGGTGSPEDPVMDMFQKMIGRIPLEMSADQTPRMPDLSNHDSKAAVSQHNHMWQSIHAISAIVFGLYIALLTEFTGTKYDRERSSLGYGSINEQPTYPSSAYYFYLFISIEVVLLSSRYFFDREDIQPEGILGLLIGFLHVPIKKYLQIFVRYMNICTTVSRDGMICIFVLGVFAWWKSR